MAYEDVLPIADVKTYLRIDAGQSEDDAELAFIRDAALGIIEKQTNHVSFAQEKTYPNQTVDNVIRVYDFPINSITDPADSTELTIKVRPGYTSYQVTSSEVDDITLNVGYSAAADFPAALREAALLLCKLQYDITDGEKLNLPYGVQMLLNQYRRRVL